MQKEPSGVLIVNKHAGVTSHDIVYKIRRLYGTKRVGHTGTLDPMATGVLVMLVGRAAKAAEYLVSDTKRYKAGLRLGITTDTEDTTGEVLTESSAIPDADAVNEACASFVGKTQQIPPMYSALKVGGQKLCDLARRGVTVERAAREVEIFELSVDATDSPADYTLDVKCSSGTYIRTLCADIGARLACGGVMSSLERTETGGYPISEAHTIVELEQMSEEERLARLLPIESLFESLPKLTLVDFYEKLSRNGCEIYQKKIKTDFDVGQRIAVYGKNGFYALGEVREYENGSAIKLIKLFELEG
jgi:tRNA pseudouridine55 synthase